MELKDKYQRKVARFKERIQSKERELAVLLEITNAINQNQSTLQIIDKFEHFIKNELLIERAILFVRCGSHNGTPEVEFSCVFMRNPKHVCF